MRGAARRNGEEGGGARGGGFPIPWRKP
uniref:Uncharacterized protein n=1 Tax=Arundo donax TaxID=35708 RepID=A0A0A9FV47_ARUDO